MKSLIHFMAGMLLLAVSSSSVFAQAPAKMNYQAVIRNAANELVKNTDVGIRISVLQTTPFGTAVYVETHTATTNINGLVGLEIGSGIPSTGTMEAIDWAAGPYFIKTETDPDGGTDYTVSGTSQLLSVPYALYAANGGVEGPQGPAGEKGDKGDQGDQGPEGPQGPQGPEGPAGPQGPEGPAGVKGDKGDKGDAGIINGTNQQVIFYDSTAASGDAEFLYDKASNHLAIGATEVNPNAALEIKSSSGALLLPRLTTAQRDAIDATEGMLIYNTDDQKFQGFVGDSGTAFVAQSEVSVSTYFIGDDGVTIDYVAQTFTPEYSGEIQSLEFNISSLSPDFIMIVELFSGDTPGSGVLLNSQQVILNALGWTLVQLPDNIELVAGSVYHFVLRPAFVSSDFIGILQSNADVEGEHAGGALFTYNSATGLFEPSFDDMDFRITSDINNRQWVDLH